MTTKKSFKRSEPANFFISGTEEEKKSPKAPKTEAKAQTKKAKPSPKAPEGFKVNYEYIETKSRRVQALVQPSIYEAVKAKASSLGISTNEAINEALRAYTEEA